MNRDVNAIVQFLVKKINPYVIYLFGSQAQQQSRKDSDIDLAFTKLALLNVATVDNDLTEFWLPDSFLLRNIVYVTSAASFSKLL
jgi:predicted nucleotidyltransferase